MTDDSLTNFSNHFYSPSEIGVIQTTIAMIMGIVFYHWATMECPIVGNQHFYQFSICWYHWQDSKPFHMIMR